MIEWSLILVASTPSVRAAACRMRSWFCTGAQISQVSPERRTVQFHASIGVCAM
jgi:hypothetical protein